MVGVSEITFIERGWIKGKPKVFIPYHHTIKTRPDLGNLCRFKIEGVYCRLISLTQRQYAIVWESDYEWLMRWKWFAKWSESTRSYYAVRQGNGKTTRQQLVYMHREILGEIGDIRIGDHKNNITLDCRRDNLRNADKFESSRNRRRQRNNQSGYKGVSFRKDMGVYAATIFVDGKNRRLGYKNNAEDAYALYCEAAKLLHGEFSHV
jgi:hypothetical protein